MWRIPAVCALGLAMASPAWANRMPNPKPIPTQPSTQPNGKGSASAGLVLGGLAVSGLMLAGGMRLVRRGRA